MFGLFRDKKKTEDTRKEINEAKNESRKQRLMLLEALDELATAKSQKGKKGD